MPKRFLQDIERSALLEEMHRKRMPKVVNSKGRKPGFDEISLEEFFKRIDRERLAKAVEEQNRCGGGWPFSKVGL